LVKPHNIRIVVVFPAPFAPRKPKISPTGIDIETLLTAFFLSNLFERFFRTMSGSGMKMGKKIFVSLDPLKMDTSEFPVRSKLC
jgi:hypothetical protein